MPEVMPDRMPEHMPEDMPDRMPEDMSDRMPEDLPVRTCINVMVGTTRSKVCFFFVLVFLSWYPSPSQTQPKTNHPKPKTNPKKQCIGEPSPLPHPKVGLPLFCVFSFLGTPPLPKPNPKQVIQNVCMFILSGVGERC